MRGCEVETKELPELIATGRFFSVTPRSKKLFLATTRVGWPLLDGKPAYSTFSSAETLLVLSGGMSSV